MSEARKESGWPVVVAVVLAVVLLPLAVYVGGYFATCTGIDRRFDWYADFRYYRYEWQAWVFQPAAKVESLLTGQTTVTDTRNDNDYIYIDEPLFP